MNSIDEFRNALHEAVDHEPTSTVDTAAVTSGALRRQRRSLAIGTASVAGFAVLALGASAQTTVVSTAAPKPPPAAAVKKTPPMPTSIKFQKPDVTVPANGQAEAFVTEHGEKIQVTNTAGGDSQSLAGLGLLLTDGSNPARGLDLSRGGWQINEPTVKELVDGAPDKQLASARVKAIRVNTKHGILLVGLSSENTDVFSSYGSEDKRSAQSGLFNGKKIVGAKQAAVFWAYLSADDLSDLVIILTEPSAGDNAAWFTLSIADRGKTLEFK